MKINSNEAGIQICLALQRQAASSTENEASALEDCSSVDPLRNWKSFTCTRRYVKTCLCSSLHSGLCWGWPIVIESNQVSPLKPQLDIASSCVVLCLHHCCLITECFIALLYGICWCEWVLSQLKALSIELCLRVCLNTAYSPGPVRLIHWATSFGSPSVAIITNLILGRIRLKVCVVAPLGVCIRVTQCNATSPLCIFSSGLWEMTLARSSGSAKVRSSQLPVLSAAHWRANMFLTCSLHLQYLWLCLCVWACVCAHVLWVCFKENYRPRGLIGMCEGDCEQQHR